VTKIRNLAYFGFADAKPEDPLFKEAYAVAKFLGEKGYHAINGGGPGVMRAVSEGAKAAGRLAVGVTFYPQDITNFEGRDKENPIGEEIITKNYLERTLKLLELGDAYVIFRGGTGTISEFGMAWGLAHLYFGHHKPLILYGDFWHNLIKSFTENMRIRPEELEVYKVVNSPQEAWEAILGLEAALAENDDARREEKPFQL
jgi:uncharacterized protein (TIGR00730 family)